MKTIAVLIVLLGMISCGNSVDYAGYKQQQDYSLPLWSYEPDNKVALFIFPHPDDEIVCAGTISRLKQTGWTINLVTLTQGEASEKAVRREEWKASVRALGIDNFELMDLPNNSWNEVMSDSIRFWYDEMDSVKQIISRSIQTWQPSVVVTYDSVFGGYGHPEHRITAQAAHAIFRAGQHDPAFPVQRILQITLPEKIEQAMLGNAPSYLHAISVTGNKTLPEPTTAVDITRYWKFKRRAALTYPSQRETLQKFFLLPDEGDTTKHYATFDREYFLEIKR